MSNQFFIFQSLWINLIMPDDSVEQFYLEAPTAKQNSFKWGFRVIQVQQDFTDSTFARVKGYKKFRHIVELNYDWHTMPIHKLLAAKTIQLKHPPGFGSTDHYISVDCILEAEEALKTYQNGLAGSMPYADSERLGNWIKSGPITLRFIGKDPKEWSDIIDEYFEQKIDSTHVTGDFDTLTADSTEIVIHE